MLRSVFSQSQYPVIPLLIEKSEIWYDPSFNLRIRRKAFGVPVCDVKIESNSLPVGLGSADRAVGGLKCTDHHPPSHVGK